MSGSVLTFLAPGVFVFLWSTGYVGAKYGLPYAEPLTFLAIRFAMAAAALAILARVFGERSTRGHDWSGAALTGFLMHALYLGAIWTAIDRGMGAGLAALIVSLQPLATALFARALGERMSALQWAGAVLGVAGVALVVQRKLGFAGVDALNVALCVIGMASAAGGSVLQKSRDAGGRLTTDAAAQMATAALVCGGAALMLETGEIDPTFEFWATLLWMVFPMSIGAIAILYWLLRKGEASRVSSLFFLVPGVTALMAWAMFGETFGWAELGGLAVASVGVAIVTLAPKRA